jgi:hypothetical protein
MIDDEQNEKEKEREETHGERPDEHADENWQRKNVPERIERCVHR